VIHGILGEARHDVFDVATFPGSEEVTDHRVEGGIRGGAGHWSVISRSPLADRSAAAYCLIPIRSAPRTDHGKTCAERGDSERVEPPGIRHIMRTGFDHQGG